MELLTQILKIYSPSGNEAKLVSFLKKKMKELGFRAKSDGVGNLIGEIGQGSREILLVGHLDTVEGIIPVEVKRDRIYGRGSVDAKGPLATFIQAASEFKDNHEFTIRVIGVVEEESSSRGAHFLKDKYQPDYVVIGEPSGWEGITLGYRGSMGVSYTLEKPLTHRGHSERIPAEEAFRFYGKLINEYDSGENGFGSISIRLTSIHTKKTPFKDGVTMKMNIRFPPGTDLAGVKSFIHRVRGEATVKFFNQTEAIKAGKKNRLVGAFLGSIRQLGGEPKFKLKTGTSDMNILGNTWDCPILAYGPGDSSLDHTPSENLEISEYQRAKKVLVGVLEQIIF